MDNPVQLRQNLFSERWKWNKFTYSTIIILLFIATVIVDDAADRKSPFFTNLPLAYQFFKIRISSYGIALFALMLSMIYFLYKAIHHFEYTFMLLLAFCCVLITVLINLIVLTYAFS